MRTLQSPKKHSEDWLWIDLLPKHKHIHAQTKTMCIYIIMQEIYTIVKLALNVIVLLPSGTLLRESADDV